MSLGAFGSAEFMQAYRTALAGEEREPIGAKRVSAERGETPIAMLTRQHLTAMLAKKINKPAAANHWLRLVKMLMDVAVAEGMRSDNPAAGIKPLKNRSEGFHTWSEEEIVAFENRHPTGSRARLALALLLYTAQRRSDIVRMGRQRRSSGRAWPWLY